MSRARAGMAWKAFSFDRRLKEISMFFQEDDAVYKTVRRLVKRLERAGIPYALVGGMAVNAHRHRRTTADVDVLLTPHGLAEFRKRFVKKNYTPVPGWDRRFMDRLSRVSIDFLITGLFPGSGEPGPFAYPDPESVSEAIGKFRVVNLAMLIQLKLAARRWKDFADVVELIRHNELDESFLDKLHPSARGDYIECLEEKRREDRYKTLG